MKTVLLVVVVLFVALVVYFFVLGYMSKSGDPIGLVDGKLAVCPAKPNCVCSDYNTDQGHYVDPIAIGANSTSDTLQKLKDIIPAMGGHIEVENSDYLAATFSSVVFGFVDDLEIRIDNDKQLMHVRSASRVGTSDLGVNTKRVETLRTQFLNSP